MIHVMYTDGSSDTFDAENHTVEVLAGIIYVKKSKGEDAVYFDASEVLLIVPVERIQKIIIA